MDVAKQKESPSFVTPLSELASKLQRALPASHRLVEPPPELAVYGKDGRPETVSYHLLATLLLNELQKEHAAVGALKVQNQVLVQRNEAVVQANEVHLARTAMLELKVAAQTAELSALRQEVALLAKLVGSMEKNRMVASAR